MIDNIGLSTPSVFDSKLPLWLDDGPPNVVSSVNYTNNKRRITNRWCARLAASGLAGSDHATEYLYGKYLKNLSISIINQSGRVVLYFLRFLEQKQTTIYRITRQDISSFVQNEQDRGQKTTSVVNYLRVVYAFLVFLVDQEVLSHKILQRKIQVKLPETLPRAIPIEDINSFLGVTTKTRDRALILLLLRTGMRIGELLKVKVSDISPSEQKVLIYIGEKNFQGRAVYYSDDAKSVLKKWLRVRDETKQYLFYGRSDTPMQYVSAYTVMRKCLECAGLSGKNYSLHSLRHTFATDMLNAGMRLEVLQHILGHQEIEMTMRYAKMSDLTRENEYFKAMGRIEQGEKHESRRVHTELQKVFEEKKLHSSKRK